MEGVVHRLASANSLTRRHYSRERVAIPVYLAVGIEDLSEGHWTISGYVIAVMKCSEKV